MIKLNDNEYVAFYGSYLDALTDYSDSIIDILHISYDETMKVLNSLPKEKYLYSYAEGKWTIKELLQHFIDTERIFTYRALRFARKDTADLSGFEENHYVTHSNANTRDFDNLLKEFNYVRESTLALFNSFTNEELLQIGTVNNNSLSVRAIGYIISGHLLHHLNVIRERYL